MAIRTYRKIIDMQCPRCGNSDILVAVYHFEQTHVPMCGNCGLREEGKICGDVKEMVEPIIKNCYYKYLALNPEPVKVESDQKSFKIVVKCKIYGDDIIGANRGFNHDILGNLSMVIVIKNN